MYIIFVDKFYLIQVEASWVVLFHRHFIGGRFDTLYETLFQFCMFESMGFGTGGKGVSYSSCKIWVNHINAHVRARF